VAYMLLSQKKNLIHHTSHIGKMTFGKENKKSYTFISFYINFLKYDFNLCIIVYEKNILFFSSIEHFENKIKHVFDIMMITNPRNI